MSGDVTRKNRKKGVKKSYKTKLLAGDTLDPVCRVYDQRSGEVKLEVHTLIAEHSDWDQWIELNQQDHRCAEETGAGNEPVGKGGAGAS